MYSFITNSNTIINNDKDRLFAFIKSISQYLQVLYNYCDNTTTCSNIKPTDITIIQDITVKNMNENSMSNFIQKSNTIIHPDKEKLNNFLKFIEENLTALHTYCIGDICNNIDKSNIDNIQKIIGFGPTTPTSTNSPTPT